MATMLEAHTDRIDLWLAFSDEITDPHLLDQYRQMLTEEEKRQQVRFHFEKDRHRHLVTRALVRTTLSQYVDIPPEQWLFSSNSYGKPEIANQHPIAQSLSFNISHTQGLIALGITKSKPLGIDAENIVSRHPPLEIADHFFSAVEISALHSLPTPDRHGRFFQYWTLKEAYIKARGMGLSIPLNRFSFHLPSPSTQGKPRFSCHPDLNDTAERWRFWQCRPSASHLMAVCVEKSGSMSQTLYMNRVIPLVESHPLKCESIFDFAADANEAGPSLS